MSARNLLRACTCCLVLGCCLPLPAQQEPAARPPFVVPEMTKVRTDLQPPTYLDATGKIPSYTKGARWGVQNAPINVMQAPMSPEESLKHYSTPVNFHMELFASEPQMGGKPIHINFDERGRLWACETVDYPNELHEGNMGRDRIRIVEDTDGDGKGDKFTIFAEGLSIPTALIFHNGGVVVQNGSETLWLKDTNGDDKADERSVLIRGWAMNDTHGGVSNFRMGLDNWFWAMQGYNNSRPTAVSSGQQLAFRQGFWRFKLDDSSPPKVTGFEFLRSTNNNTWGLGISEEGIIFGSTANNCPSVYLPIPNRYYEMVRGWGPAVLAPISDSNDFHPLSDKVRQVDWFDGYTAGAGHALYTGRNYPQQWWNRTAFTCEPTGKLVGTFIITEKGADYASTAPFNIVASIDEWAAPIMAEVGPDGNVWVLDWYNYIIQHNPTPQGFENGKGNAYESDVRDKLRGRIYRVLYDGDGTTPAGKNEIVSLAGKTPAQLVEFLKHPTMLVRLHAQRLIRESKDLSVVPQLCALVADQNRDAIGLSVGPMHALWTLEGLGVCTAEHPEVIAAIKGVFAHPARGVRRNAIQVFPVALVNEENKDALRKLASDADAQVRLATYLRLADAGAAGLVSDLTAEASRNPANTGERWLREALTSASSTDAENFLAKIGRNPQGEAAPLDVAMLETVSRVAQHYAQSRPTAAQVEKLIAVWPTSDKQVVTATLQGLVAGWPRNQQIQLSDATSDILKQLLETLPQDGQGHLVALATPWSSAALKSYAEAILAEYRKLVANDAAATPERLNALGFIMSIAPEDGDIVGVLLQTVTPQADPAWAFGVLDGLKSSTAENVGTQLLGITSRLTPALREATFTTLLARPNTTQNLLAALEGGTVKISDLSLLQQRQLSDHPNRQIARRAQAILASGGGLPNPDRQRVIEEFTAITTLSGDVELGKAVFVKNCAKCHQHGAIGEHIGPNLTGMGVHPKSELLVHILDPGRSVEGNYRSYTAATEDGRIYNGMMVAETRTSIELFDAEAKRHLLQRDQIEQLVVSEKSLMPEGFEKLVTRDEFVNLLEFLSTKGPYLPLDFRGVANIVSTKRMFSGELDTEKMILENWEPRTIGQVPFVLIDPKEESVANAIMLYSPLGTIPPTMPRQAILPVKTKGKALHILGGVAAWAFPYSDDKTVSHTVVINYADGTSERHDMRNSVEIADYVRKAEVPGSQYALDARGRQIRYVQIPIGKPDQIIQTIELVKGPDQTAPVVFAMTVELP